MGSKGRGGSSGSAVLPDVSEIMSAFARVYFPARVVQRWKKISLSKEGKGGERGKKKLKKKEKKKAPQSRRGGVGPSAGSADSRGGDVRGRGKVSALERVPAF